MAGPAHGGDVRQIVGLGTNRLGYWNAALAYAGICGAAPIYAVLSLSLAVVTLPCSARVAMIPQDALYWSFQEFMRLYFELYPGLRVVLHGEAPRDEDCVYIANHQSNMDWFIAVLLAGEVGGGSGRLRYMLKDTLTMLPLFGWVFSLHGCVYVSKSSQTNRRQSAEALVSRTRKLGADGVPVWLVVFPEGTRFNPVRYPWQLHESAQAAATRGENAADFTQIKFPRAGGFACSVLGLRDRVAAVYDVTAAYTVRRPDRPDLGPHRPALCTMEAMMAGQFHELHIHLSRTPVNALPATDTELQAWLVGQFKKKNDLLESFYGGRDGDGVGADGAMGPGRPPRPSVGTTAACALFWNALMVSTFLSPQGRRLYLLSLVVGGLGGSTVAAARLALLRRW